MVVVVVVVVVECYCFYINNYCWQPWRATPPFRSRVAPIFIKTYRFVYVKRLGARAGPFVVVTLFPIIFVRRRGGRAMSPSPLCGGIVVFQFYPHKNQCKIAWARVGGVWGVSCLPLGCSGWLPGVQRGVFWVFAGALHCVLFSRYRCRIAFCYDRRTCFGTLQPQYGSPRRNLHEPSKSISSRRYFP